MPNLEQEKSKLINSIIKAYEGALAYDTEDAKQYYDWLATRHLNFGICAWICWIYKFVYPDFGISELSTWFKVDFLKTFMMPSVGAYLCAHPENVLQESKLFPDDHVNELTIKYFKSTLQQRLDRLLMMKEHYNLK